MNEMNKLEEVKKQIAEIHKNMDEFENGFLIDSKEAQLILFEGIFNFIKGFQEVHHSEMPSILKFVNDKIEEAAKGNRYYIHLKVKELLGVLNANVSEIDAKILMERLFKIIMKKGFGLSLLGKNKATEYEAYEFSFKTCKYISIKWFVE